MQQRRVRLGDILDDYCPRERRVTNHAVVAMVDEDVKQTRCTTCDAEHEYKDAKVPASRRKKVAGALAGDLTEAGVRPRTAHAPPEGEGIADDAAFDESTVSDNELDAETPESMDAEADAGNAVEDEWPVHRPLIRATLPRPEGHTPERKAPEFTSHAPQGRGPGKRSGQRHRGNHPRQAGQSSNHQNSRFGLPPRQGQRQGGDGNRAGGGQGGQRGGRPTGQAGGGQPRGQGRKRGR